MASSRFAFALKHVRPDQWPQFENLCTEFLVEEFNSLRVLAHPAGDRGRDAMLLQPEGESQLAVQYSVADDWEKKIKATVTRLGTTHPQVSVLIFMSPHEIGAAADSLRADTRQTTGVHLDIRDGHWFATRETASAKTLKASDWFSDFVLANLSPGASVTRTGAALSSEETRAALLYLVLQRQDDDLERHLTKLCYDALVRMILRQTDNDNRMPRAEIHQQAADLLSTHPRSEVTAYVDRALERMNKRFVRHWQKDDEYCLTHDERERLAEAIAAVGLSDEEFEVELLRNLQFVAQGLGLDTSVVDVNVLTSRIRRVLETYLFERGEAFAAAVAAGQPQLYTEEETEALVERDLADHPDTSSLRGNVVPLVARVVERTLTHPGEEVQSYLRAVADAYTLLAFLRETPNVQSAVSKLFSNGEIWIDTSALLPVFAEELLDAPERGYTHLLEAALEAGAKLYVTEGVLDEIASHLDNAALAARLAGSWKSRTPFLLSSYLWAGYPLGEFASWLERFRGKQRPLDDLTDYLREEHQILRNDLNEDYEGSEDALRWHVDSYWQEVHERRRAQAAQEGRIDPEVVRQLAAHDSINFLGVLERRSGEEIGNPFGYSSWWLSLDRHAHRAAADIADRAGLERIDSPVLSFEFLTYYLAVGPARRRLKKSREAQLPLVIDTSLTNSLPRDLLSAADEIRSSMTGMPDRVIRRRIRDHLDAEKLREGRVGRTTIEAIEDDIRLALQSSAQKRKRQ